MAAAVLVTLMFAPYARLVSARAMQDSALPITPDPSECTETVTVDELLARLNVTEVPATPESTAVATPLVPEEETASPAAQVSLPDGDPADEATIAAVTKTMRQVLACENAGNTLGSFALLSDSFVRESQAEEPFTKDDAALLAASPEALPADVRATLYAVHDVRVLAGGRIGALVETDFPDQPPDGIEVDFLFFIEQDGRYLIDDVIEDLEGQYPPVSATVTP